MDWRRVKTILIMALIFINALLGYTVYNDRNENEVKSLDRDMIIDLLNDKQVEVDSDILDVSFEIPNISLTIQTYDEEFIETVFESYDNYDKDKLHRLMKPIDTTLVYETVETGVLDLTVLSDEKDDIFLRKQGRTGKKTILTFGQRYKGITIRDSYMIVKFNNENLLNVERVWYDVVELSSMKRDFRTPEEALFEFNRQLYNQNPNREQPLTIDSFSLVYQLRDVSIVENSNVLVSGEPRVHYEINTSNGDAYLINAIDSQKEEE